jgi:hypothetical protein
MVHKRVIFKQAHGARNVPESNKISPKKWRTRAYHDHKRIIAASTADLFPEERELALRIIFRTKKPQTKRPSDHEEDKTKDKSFSPV